MVSIDYFPMKDDQGKLMNIVAVATDKTKEIQAIESFKEEEQYVAMILKILNNKVQFESFIAEVHSIFEQFKSAYIESEDKLNLDRVRGEHQIAMLMGGRVAEELKIGRAHV